MRPSFGATAAVLACWLMVGAGQGLPAVETGEVSDSVFENQRYNWQPADLVKVLGSHRGHHWWEVYACAFVPEGSRVVSGGGDKNLWVWDAHTLQPVASATDLAATIQSVACHPDGKHIAAGLANGQVSVFRLLGDNLTEVHRLTGHGQRVSCLEYTTDGTRLIAGCGSKVHIYDVSQEHPLETNILPASSIWDLDVSRDGSWLAVASSEELVVWGIATAKPQQLARADANALSVAVSPDGQTIVTGSLFREESLTVWQLQGTELHRHATWKPGSQGGIRTVGFAPRGDILASSTGYNRGIQLWDMTQSPPTKLATLTGHTSKTFDLDFSPDGKTLATASSDHTLRIWDLDGEPRATVASQQANRLPTRMTQIDYALDGGRLVFHTGRTEGLSIVDLATGRLSKSVSGFAKESYFAGTMLLSPKCDRVAHLFEPSRTEQQPDVSALPRMIELRDVDAAESAHVLEGQFTAFAWSPDGQELATGDKKGQVQRWNAETGRPIDVLETQGTTKALSFDVARRSIVAVQQSRDELADFIKQIVVWNIAAMPARLIATHEIKQPNQLDEVVIAPDARRVALRQRNGPIHILNLGEGGLVKVAEIHTHGQYFLDEFSPDGSLLALHSWGGPDNRVSLFDSATGNVLREWELPGDQLNASFAPNGRELAISNLNGTIYIMRVPETSTPAAAVSSTIESEIREKDTGLPSRGTDVGQDPPDDNADLRRAFDKLDKEYDAAVQRLRESWRREPPKRGPGTSVKDAFTEELPYLVYARHFLDLAESAPRTATGRDAFLRVCQANLIAGAEAQNVELRRLQAKASSELLKRHFADPTLAKAVSSICWNTENPEQAARRFIREHGDRNVQAHASLVLARFYGSRLNRNSTPDERDVATRLFRRIIDEYRDLPFYDGGPTFGDVAAKELKRIVPTYED